MRTWTLAPACLALAACAPSEPAEPASTEAETTPAQAAADSIAFSAEEVERLEARIDQDPAQAVRLLEQVVGGSVASLSDEQFDELRNSLLGLRDEGRLEKLVRAGRELPATSAEVRRLLDDLEAWDAAILRGVDIGNFGYLDEP